MPVIWCANAVNSFKGVEEDKPSSQLRGVKTPMESKTHCNMPVKALELPKTGLYLPTITIFHGLNVTNL